MVATWYGDDGPHLFLPDSQPLTAAVRERARVTGKAGENGRHSAEGRLTLTRPSALGCGDTSKALASGWCSLELKVGIVFKKDGSGVAIDWVTGRSYSRTHKRVKGDGSMYSQAHVTIRSSSVAVSAGSGWVRVGSASKAGLV